VNANNGQEYAEMIDRMADASARMNVEEVKRWGKKLKIDDWNQVVKDVRAKRAARAAKIDPAGMGEEIAYTCKVVIELREQIKRGDVAYHPCASLAEELASAEMHLGELLRGEAANTEKTEYQSARSELDALTAKRERLCQRHREELSPIEKRIHALHETIEHLACNAEEWGSR